MADGRSVIEGYLRAADTDATLRVIAQLGAGVKVNGDSVAVDGVGLRGPKVVADGIGVDNSGTLMRLVSGWLAGQPGGSWRIDGDESIRTRPIGRIATPLTQMGATVTASDGTAPFELEGARLRAIDYELPVPSAQVKSAILIAGLLADGTTVVRENLASRDHTERMLIEQGADLEVVRENGGVRVSVAPAESLNAVDRLIPGDPSSAAFALTAALLIADANVELTNVCLNDGRTGLFRILKRMGANINWDGSSDESARSGLGPESAGSVTAGHSALVGTEVSGDEIPSAIDELPLLALAACFAEGQTIVTGASELRVKETDRIATVVNGLRGLGAQIEALEDGFVVDGGHGVKGGQIESHGDHRIAMMGAIAGLASEDGVEVVDFDAVSVSYPDFESDITSLVEAG